jgi:hypothetical protein
LALRAGVLWNRACAFGTLGLLCVISLSPNSYAQDAQLIPKINEAIDKGAAFLKTYTEDGQRGTKRPASWALRGWALLEAGVPTDDAAVKKLVDYVRQEVPEMDKVYDLSLALIFLDKYGDPGDEPLIESMAVRLLAGQGTKGGWDYGVDVPGPVERARLAKLILNTEQARLRGFAIKPRTRTPQEAAQDIVRQLSTIRVGSKNFAGDNSNTQFAMMAVWVARRHGVPVQACLELVDKRFQVSQLKSGLWGYYFPEQGPPEDDSHFTYPAMTCAGLLGLALGQGVQAHPKDLLKDIQVQRALGALNRAMEEPPPEKRPNFHYFLFSLERAAVIYDIKKIGEHDWYVWGARKLVDTQSQNGSWAAGFERDAADTCFALLFLKRANVARDLTEILQAPLRAPPGRKGPGATKPPETKNH